MEEKTVLATLLLTNSIGYSFGHGLGRGLVSGLQEKKLDFGSQKVLQLGSNLNLDNSIKNEPMPCFSQNGVENMAYKINKTVMINGQKKWIHANTDQEYCDKIIQLSGGTITAPQKEMHPFPEYAQRWFDVYSKPNIEAATAVTYQRQIDIHLNPAFKGKNIEEITTADIQDLFNSMGDCAKDTKNKVKIVLNQILACAVEDGLIAKNPMNSSRLKISGKKSNETPPYSLEQIRYIVSHIGMVESAQDRAYIALLSLHPFRLEEVLGLQWKDIDWEANHIYIRQVVTHPNRNQPEIKEPKTEKSKRQIHLELEAKKYLTIGEPDSYLVGGEKPLSYSQVSKMNKRIQKQIGFSESISPRRFRTTVLTDLYDQTKDIKLTQAAAGHTTADMTLKHYVKGRNGNATYGNTITSLYTSVSN